MGNSTLGNHQIGVNCYTTAEYTADPVTHYVVLYYKCFNLKLIYQEKLYIFDIGDL